VTLISSSDYHYYSGMGPGMLSGIYRPQEIRFHISKLAEDRGASFLKDSVERNKPFAADPFSEIREYSGIRRVLSIQGARCHQIRCI